MLHGETTGVVREQLEERLDVWIGIANKKGANEGKASLEGIKSTWAGDIPT
jgi:hypothetical protein